MRQKPSEAHSKAKTAAKSLYTVVAHRLPGPSFDLRRVASQQDDRQDQIQNGKHCMQPQKFVPGAARRFFVGLFFRQDSTTKLRSRENFSLCVQSDGALPVLKIPNSRLAKVVIWRQKRCGELKFPAADADTLT